MQKVQNLGGILIVLILLVTSCAPAVAPAAQPALKATPSVAVPARPAWEEKWNRTVAEAKKEGTAVVTTRFPSTVRLALAEAFKKKYDIEVEFIAGQIVEIWPKIQAERRQGLYIKDIVMDGGAALIPTLVAEGVADPLEPELVLPEVMDPGAWRDKRLPFMDNEHKVFLFLSRLSPTIVINKDLVRPEQIKSWRDVLKPEWKGKILMMDPSIAGPGNAMIAALGEIMGVEFLKELAKQEPVMNRDMRLQVEWVARGRYALGLAFEFTVMEEIRGAGAPISHLVPVEGTWFGAGVGGISLVNRPQHPYAARLFLNWFLSREGQSVLAKSAKEQSRRVDVPVELAPDRLFQEGIKYMDGDTEYMINKREEIKKLSKEIFAAQYK